MLVMSNNQLLPMIEICNNPYVSRDFLISVNDNESAQKELGEGLIFPVKFLVRCYDKESPIYGQPMWFTVGKYGNELQVDKFEIWREIGDPPISPSTLRDVPVADAMTAIHQFIQRPRAFSPLIMAEYMEFSDEVPETWGHPRSVRIAVDVDNMAEKSLEELQKLEDFPPLIESGDTYKIEDSGYIEWLRSEGPGANDVQQVVRLMFLFAKSRKFAPIKFLSEVLGIPQSTASHWVKLTRESGVLPPATRRARTDRKK